MASGADVAAVADVAGADEGAGADEATAEALALAAGFVCTLARAAAFGVAAGCASADGRAPVAIGPSSSGGGAAPGVRGTSVATEGATRPATEPRAACGERRTMSAVPAAPKATAATTTPTRSSGRRRLVVPSTEAVVPWSVGLAPATWGVMGVGSGIATVAALTSDTGAAMGTGGVTPGFSDTRRSSARMSRALGYRSSRNFRSARSAIASRRGSVPGTSCDGAGGSSVMCLSTIPIAFSASNGTRRVSISKRITPTE